MTNLRNFISSGKVSSLVPLVILFLIYFSVASLGLRFDPVSGFATLIWPSTGIAIAALILFGYRLWPAIALGAFFVNFLAGASLPIALGIAVGNTLEAFLGTYILKEWFDFDPSLKKLSDVVVFIIFAAVLATSVSASIGVASLFLGGQVAFSSLPVTWLAWWVGDGISALVLVPLILYLKNNFFFWRETLKREYWFWILAVLLTTIIVFNQILNPVVKSSPISFLIFPPLVWGALRFGQPSAAISTFLVTLLAIVGTARGMGPFASRDLSDSLLYLHFFISVISITTLILSSSEYERKEAQIKALRLNSALQEQIKEVERLNTLMLSEIKKDRADKVKAKPPSTERI